MGAVLIVMWGFAIRNEMETKVVRLLSVLIAILLFAGCTDAGGGDDGKDGGGVEPIDAGPGDSSGSIDGGNTSEIDGGLVAEIGEKYPGPCNEEVSGVLGDAPAGGIESFTLYGYGDRRNLRNKMSYSGLGALQERIEYTYDEEGSLGRDLV
jgi:hypothetical protein